MRQDQRTAGVEDPTEIRAPERTVPPYAVTVFDEEPPELHSWRRAAAGVCAATEDVEPPSGQCTHDVGHEALIQRPDIDHPSHAGSPCQRRLKDIATHAVGDHGRFSHREVLRRTWAGDHDRVRFTPDPS
jgi:hypothetical protein